MLGTGREKSWQREKVHLNHVLCDPSLVRTVSGSSCMPQQGSMSELSATIQSRGIEKPLKLCVTEIK